ncbi:hypothetical protein HMPREF9413_3956 [Paenibacillus sp. HGF7]|nr:hypothetical protein HMPREF9413_3956 [Paenibacillus sp. HGF7]
MKTRLVHKGAFTLVEDIHEALTPPESGFYWIDADVDDLEQLQPLFHLHDLAVEDCLSEEEQRPKNRNLRHALFYCNQQHPV